jgi:Ca2+/Na+ antiporter
MGSTKKRLPRWILFSIIGIDMITIGAIMRLLVPMQPEDLLILIPLALIGLGALLIFVSIVSFRGMEKRKNQTD